ncbi:MAG: methyltransferase domain-containing protein, partial [Candidatus Rokubacteria bacterium]|nr:methyltransferase domain-containing protein [Candidatus Rokubacteria bacterium]
MGVSDRYHFAWLCEALDRFEDETGHLAAIRRGSGDLALWCLGEQRVNPPIAYLWEALGRERTRATFFDKFPTDPAVRAQDIDALENLPDNACDVLTLFRASMFITDPPVFLAHVRRLVRPGGLVLIDWLHGLSDAPVLDLRGDPRHGGSSTPFMTTYADPEALADFSAEFERFIRHVNRPPWWANLERPGAPLPLAERVKRLLGRGPRRAISLATYLETLRAELARAGKHLIEPGLMEQHFKVVFRHARYFYPLVKKFNLYLLTV